eukprot:3365609-Alexandrium_andersonii.AAC.1
MSVSDRSTPEPLAAPPPESQGVPRLAIIPSVSRACTQGLLAASSSSMAQAAPRRSGERPLARGKVAGGGRARAWQFLS